MTFRFQKAWKFRPGVLVKQMVPNLTTSVANNLTNLIERFWNKKPIQAINLDPRVFPSPPTSKRTEISWERGFQHHNRLYLLVLVYLYWNSQGTQRSLIRRGGSAPRPTHFTLWDIPFLIQKVLWSFRIPSTDKWCPFNWHTYIVVNALSFKYE